jgi:hypothetical protein
MQNETSIFDEAEAAISRGTAWRFREEGAPNPLTIQTGDGCWSSGHTKLGTAEFLSGTDRDGKRWSVLVGGAVLSKYLLEGVFEEWDSDTNGFVVVETLGRVQPNEIVSIKYLGDRQGTKYVYPDFKVIRRPVPATSDAGISAGAEASPAGASTIPFRPVAT